MSRNYDELKKELTSLLSFIKQAEVTFDDARQKLVEPVKIEKEKAKNELQKYREEMKYQIEDKRKDLSKLVEKYIKGEERNAVVQLADEKAKGFPWLVNAYNEFFSLQDMRMADYLEVKQHPAIKAAEEHRQISKERREAEKAARNYAYIVDYCKYLAPWLDDYIGLETQELDKIIKDIHTTWEKKEKEFDEEVKRQYGPKYGALTPIDKLQRKLDWYWNKPNKSDWQLGRDYERYVGYLYELQGWKVNYHGKEGFEDLGRDLICKKDNAVEIIQCKRWAQNKQIHEKHIYYLLGTTIEYYLDNLADSENLQISLLPELINKKQVIPKLVSTAQISDRAEQAAKVLGVVIEKTLFPNIIPPYPSIKCNVSRRTGEKIYHLPFDQQYDTVLVEEEKLECFAGTVMDAEKMGFRHAHHWKGEI
jgi:hypothetical protein